MSKKGLIVVNGYKLLPSVKYSVDRLIEEFKLLSVEIDVKKSTEILCFLNRDITTSRLKDYSFCIFLDKDYYISKMLEQAGMKLFNSCKSIELCDDKMKTYLELTNQGIQMPKTFSGPLNYSGEKTDEFILNLVKELDFPIVIKENYGSQGSKVYMANNLDELTRIEDSITSTSRLFQETIKSSWGTDYRLILIGGKYVAAMKRFSTNGDFRSNINLGGSGEIVNPPSSYIEVAEKAAKILNLDYCGVDLLISESGPILCEVNSNAFFKKFEEVTGQNIAEQYATYILNKIN